MPTATPAERRMIAAYRAAGSMKCAAAALGMSEGNLRNRLSRAYRRHAVRNITELVMRIDHEAENAAEA